MTLRAGAIRLRGVSRSFRIAHERNATLKEVLLRGRRGSFTDLWALKEVDLDIAPGEAVGIIGQNGSGKSTLLKLVAGILSPQAGTIEVAGTVASLLELGAGFHPDFSGRENVFMNGAIHGLSEREIAERFDDIVAFDELDGFIDMPVKTYSSGMQMRLAFAVSSHVNPDILLLDEVMAVGDEAFQRKCYGKVFEFRRRGGTLLFVSHDATAVERACDRVLYFANGAIVADGTPAEVLGIYHRTLAHGGAHSEGAETRADARGEVSVTGVRLLGDDGPSDSFATGDTLTIEVAIDAHRQVETPIFGIAIHSVEGALVYGTNTRLDDLALDHLLGVATAQFTIANLPLHEGRFAVTVAVHSWDESTVYEWLDRCIEFSVFPKVSGIGLVDLSGSWAVERSVATR
jgi:ABC-type polysaccharide/polyol phosphate transport system ATPase subunit